MLAQDSDEELATPPLVTTTRHTGADFEAGRVGRPRGDVILPGVPIIDARLPEDNRACGGRQTPLGFVPAPFTTVPAAASRTAAVGEGTGRSKDKRQLWDGSILGVPQRLAVHKPEVPAEDQRWVLILEVNPNGTKKYKCVRCGWERTCKLGVLIEHGLKLDGGQGKKCTFEPTVEQRETLDRARRANLIGASAAAKAGGAAGGTPSIDRALKKNDKLCAKVDEALAQFIAVHDFSFHAFDKSNVHWTAVVDAIKAAGVSYVPAKEEVLSEHRERPSGSREGGLFLAKRTVERERSAIFTSLTSQEINESGTVVSDGAKISTRKRGMLNSALVTVSGVLLLQSTDATGKTKDANYLTDDGVQALKKAGPWSIISKKLPDGTMVTKINSKIVKVWILDRGGGCVQALSLMEERARVITDTCKGHGADLLIEDIAKPFKKHLKQVHEMIVFIISHDAVYGIFISFPDTRALCIPAETRFATEVICVRSLLKDKAQVRKLFVDEAFDEWLRRQPAPIKMKARQLKALALDDAWWHRCDVFEAIESVPETALRCLDSNDPNLKDVALCCYIMEKEFKEPLTSKLAGISGWREFNLQLDLGSEYLGSLQSYALAMLKKRLPDMLSVPVKAAAAANPIYSFSSDQSLLWTVPGGDAAMGIIIPKLYWGEVALQAAAIAGWERFAGKKGIYSVTAPEYGLLEAKAADAIGFYRQVHRSSQLPEDKAFAQIGLWLVSAFAIQAAAERMNKYVAEVHTKKNSRMQMEKGAVKLEVKTHEIFKKAQKRVNDKEQRIGRVSIAEDLKAMYERKRSQALEKVRLERELTQIRAMEEAGEEAEAAQAANAAETGAEELDMADVMEVLGGGEAALSIPEGYRVVAMPPSEAELDRSKAESDVMLGKKIVVRCRGYGWCVGEILRKVTRGNSNFIAKFDIDSEPSTLTLEPKDYDTAADGQYEAWMLLELKGDADKEGEVATAM